MPFIFSGYTADETLTNSPWWLSERLLLQPFRFDGRRRPADDTGAPLDHEVETWNPEGDSYVWVRIPQFTSGTKIWAYLAQQRCL